MKIRGDFFTSIDQSKHLIDLGLNPETADMCWGIDEDTLQYNNNPYPLPWKDYTAKEFYLPCWSLTALLKLMEPIRKDSDMFNWEMRPCFGGVEVEYHEVTTNLILNYEEGETATEAAYNMVCWLFENNKMCEEARAKGEQKTNNNVEPKFKVGDWVVRRNGETFCNHSKFAQITKIDEKERCWFDSGSWLEAKDIKLWTNKEAKDGDVLAASDGSIFIFKEVVDCGCKHYIALEKDNETINVNDNLEHVWEAVQYVKPASQEQRELLFTKMKESGYEWDAEKKELKKIEQKPSTSVTEFDAEVERFCKECFITDANEKDKVFCIARHFADWQKNRKNPAWSEEEIRNLQDIDSILFYDRRLTEDVRTRLRNSLKSLKDRVLPQPKSSWCEEECQIIEDAACFILSCVNTAETKEEEERLEKLADKLQNLRPQPKQKWSEEDESIFNDIMHNIHFAETHRNVTSSPAMEKEQVNWLKSLKDRYTWKPTDEQMKALEEAIEFLGCTKKVREYLKSLVFIEKAISWLKEQDEIIGVSFQEDFLERFKNYMKGE